MDVTVLQMTHIVRATLETTRTDANIGTSREQT